MVAKIEEVAETEGKASEIWIITPDFYWDNEDAEYREKVLVNVNAGKNYRYLFPKHLMHIAEGLKARFKSKKTHFTPVPDDIFNLLHFEIALYDPEDPASLYHRGYIIDIPHIRNLHKSYDVKLDEKHALPNYIRIFKEFIKRYNEI